MIDLNPQVGSDIELNVPQLAGVCAGTGFPSPATDYAESSLNFNEYLIAHPSATFTVRVAGQSMEPLIREGSLVIVDRSLTPKNNDVVVAVVQNEFTLKKYIQSPQGHCLKPENPRFKTFFIKPEDEIEIWGVVTYSITSHREI